MCSHGQTKRTAKRTFLWHAPSQFQKRGVGNNTEKHYLCRQEKRSFDLMQDEVKYRTSLVPKSLAVKQRIFANNSYSKGKTIQNVFYGVWRYLIGVGCNPLLFLYNNLLGGRGKRFYYGTIY